MEKVKSKMSKIMDGIEEPKPETKGMTLLERSQSKPSDEYYTREEDVEKLEALFRDILKSAAYVYCPFDGEESAFVTVLRGMGYDVRNTQDDYRTHGDLFRKCKEEGGIVFSNPPFFRNA